MEENKTGMTVKGLLIRLILIIIFIFLLIWLFPMPDLKPLNNQIFSDNLDRMKNVAKTYYTTERLPKNIDEFKMMTLQEMIKENYIMPLMDSNGKYCSEKDSYVKITKKENEYIIKVYLSCTDKKDYIIEHFGCYDICSDACKALETAAQETTKNDKITTKKGSIYEYQFVKESCAEDFDKYVCPTGYGLVGNKCMKKGSQTVSVAAKENITSVTSTDTKKAEAITSDKSELVDAVCKDKEVTSTIDASVSKVQVGAIKTTSTQKVTANKLYTYDVKGAIVVKKNTYTDYSTIQNYDVITANKIASSKWTYDYTTISTSSNLAYTNDTEKLVYIEAFSEPTCPTCFTPAQKHRYYHYVKETTYSYNCDGFSGYSLYNGKYCRKATTITKGCPAGYSDTGTNCKKSEIVSYNCNSYGSDYVLDSNAKTCTKTTTSYSCPAGTEATSDASICKKVNVSYSCPAGTDKTSDQTKCSKDIYSCPKSTSDKTYTLSGTKCIVKSKTQSCTCPAGTNPTSDDTKCAKKSSSTSYSCSIYSGYDLVGTNCVKTTTTNKKTYSCDSGYTLNGANCVKTVNSSDTKNAQAVYKTTCSTKYKWSTKTSMSGWNFTGNKRLVK